MWMPHKDWTRDIFYLSGKVAVAIDISGRLLEVYNVRHNFVSLMSIIHFDIPILKCLELWYNLKIDLPYHTSSKIFTKLF